MQENLKTEEAKTYTKEEVLLIIHQYIRENLEVSIRKSTNEDSFSRPAWSEYQAYQLGIQKMCYKLAEFIPHPDPESN